MTLQPPFVSRPRTAVYLHCSRCDRPIMLTLAVRVSGTPGTDSYLAELDEGYLARALGLHVRTNCGFILG